MANEEREPARFGKGAEASVLLILAQGPSYGYELRKQLESFGYEQATSDQAALYRLLRDLEAAGSIASEWHTEGSGPARRYYRLTPQGTDHLARAAERMRTLKWRAELFLSAYQDYQETQAASAPHLDEEDSVLGGARL